MKDISSGGGGYITLWCHALESLNHQYFDNSTDWNSFPIAAAPAHFLAIKPENVRGVRARRCPTGGKFRSHPAASVSFSLLLKPRRFFFVFCPSGGVHRLSRWLLMAS